MKRKCKTGKKCFDRVGAMMALSQIHALRKPKNKEERRYYACQFCNKYHLTSQEKH